MGQVVLDNNTIRDLNESIDGRIIVLTKKAFPYAAGNEIPAHVISEKYPKSGATLCDAMMTVEREYSRGVNPKFGGAMKFHYLYLTCIRKKIGCEGTICVVEATGDGTDLMVDLLLKSVRDEYKELSNRIIKGEEKVRKKYGAGDELTLFEKCTNRYKNGLMRIPEIYTMEEISTHKYKDRHFLYPTYEDCGADLLEDAESMCEELYFEPTGHAVSGALAPS